MEVNCVFKVDENLLGYRLIVTDCKITDPADRIAFFKGEHWTEKSNDDVRSLEFFNTVVRYFPKDLLRFFPHVPRIEITNCGLKQISRQDLNGLEHLEVLQLVNCNLKTLPDDLFTNMPKLRYIDFRDNPITSASSELVKPLLGRERMWFDLRSFAYSFEDRFVLQYADESSIKTFGNLIDESFSKPSKDENANETLTKNVNEPDSHKITENVEIK